MQHTGRGGFLVWSRLVPPLFRSTRPIVTAQHKKSRCSFCLAPAITLIEISSIVNLYRANYTLFAGSDLLTSSGGFFLRPSLPMLFCRSYRVRLFYVTFSIVDSRRTFFPPLFVRLSLSLSLSRRCLASNSSLFFCPAHLSSTYTSIPISNSN